MIKKHVIPKISALLAAFLMVSQFAVPTTAFAANSSYESYEGTVLTDDVQSDNSLDVVSDSATVSASTASVTLPNGFVVTYSPEVQYPGHALKDADDFGIALTYNGASVSSSNIKLKVKNGKNAGTATVTVKSVKGIKGSRKLLKGGSSLSITINPYNIAQASTKKITATVNLSSRKVVKVTIKINDNTYKVSKKYWTQNGKYITFSGNYTGTCYFSSL